MASRATLKISNDSQYELNGAKQGFQVFARLPQRFKVGKGAAVNMQNVEDETVAITLTDQANVGVEFNSASLTMEIDNYDEKCIKPAVDTLVNAVDSDGLARMYLKVYHQAGTPGVVPGSTGTLPQAANRPYLDIGVKLTNAAVPMDGRVAMLNADMHSYLANANIAVFNPVGTISEQYRSGQFGRKALGIDEWFLDQNVATQTTGSPGGTPRIDGANQTGTTINLKGLTVSTGTLKAGDILSFTGCNMVNPQSYNDMGKLQDFVVQQDVTASAAGLVAVSVLPALITSGNKQTVTASPADSALVNFYGTAQAGQSAISGVASPQALVYHPEAFALVMADLALPGGLWVSERLSNKELGVSIRFLKGHDIKSDESVGRCDCLYGWAATRNIMAGRIAS